MKSQPRVAIFVNHPECSVQSAHGILRALSNDFDIDCIGRHQLRDRVIKKYDLVAVPGGIGDSDTWHNILEPFQDCVYNHLAKNKKYLGICMGAYWAGSYYLNVLNGVEPMQYIRRPGSSVRRSFGTTVKVTWENQVESMYFYDGCSFVGHEKTCQVIARYPNQDPAAIIQGNLGLIGPHPESDIYWYSKAYMKSKWHNYRHHQLLIDFVKKLMGD